MQVLLYYDTDTSCLGCYFDIPFISIAIALINCLHHMLAVECRIAKTGIISRSQTGVAYWIRRIVADAGREFAMRGHGIGVHLEETANTLNGSDFDQNL